LVGAYSKRQAASVARHHRGLFYLARGAPTGIGRGQRRELSGRIGSRLGETLL